MLKKDIFFSDWNWLSNAIFKMVTPIILNRCKNQLSLPFTVPKDASMNLEWGLSGPEVAVE